MIQKKALPIRDRNGRAEWAHQISSPMREKHQANSLRWET
jgi:hypothetical protein